MGIDEAKAECWRGCFAERAGGGVIPMVNYKVVMQNVNISIIVYLIITIAAKC